MLKERMLKGRGEAVEGNGGVNGKGNGQAVVNLIPTWVIHRCPVLASCRCPASLSCAVVVLSSCVFVLCCCHFALLHVGVSLSHVLVVSLSCGLLCH